MLIILHCFWTEPWRANTEVNKVYTPENVRTGCQPGENNMECSNLFMPTTQSRHIYQRTSRQYVGETQSPGKTRTGATQAKTQENSLLYCIHHTLLTGRYQRLAFWNCWLQTNRWMYTNQPFISVPMTPT